MLLLKFQKNLNWIDHQQKSKGKGDKMDIEQMLREHLEKSARIRFRELDIESLKEKLRFRGKINIETEDDVIKGLSMGAKAISNMPVSATNKFHSSTEDAAMNYRDEVINTNSFNIEQVKSSISNIEFELEPLRKAVQQVDIFLDGLTDRERFIAEKFYIHAWTWEEVTCYYNKEMPVTKQKWALKDVKNNLIEKMKRISQN